MTDEEEDDFVSSGTPLPEIEDEATLRKKAVKQLQVRDEKGRQRFHGAFTGGFSAGYFNTVGTKEGWAPATFLSSRTKNADRIQQNPEDFMDDEDLGEFGIATRKIHTSSYFQDDSSTSISKRKFAHTDTVIPGEAPLKDIVRPISESIGVQILTKLGWRHGQGIGPRTKKQIPSTKVYGCSPFPDATQAEEEDQTALSYTFAPKDTDSLYFKPKDDYFGLGYSGLSKESILSAHIDLFAPTSTKSFLKKDKKKIMISGQAFGVGAFEDDDDDIYSKDDMSQYDFLDLTFEGEKGSQKDIEPKKQKEAVTIIQGFRSASQPPTVRKYYPPPTLPANYTPIHLKATGTLTPSINFEKSRHSLSATDRSVILGENKFQKSTNVIPVETVKKDTAGEPSHAVIPVKTSSAHFQPFPNDISKQQRYEEYLRLKEKGEIDKLVQPLLMTEWEKQQEVEEFAKAAVRFKPLSNVLSSRFESRSHLSVEHEVMAALEKIKREKESKPTVKKKLVGTSNRKMFEWHPVSLLCKRMNVPNPYPNSGDGSVQTVLKTKSVFDHLTFTQDKSKMLDENTSLSIPSSTHSVENAVKGESNKSPTVQPSDVPMHSANKELPPENKRPPIDLFKAIFANSSSDEDSEEEKAEQPNRDSISDNQILPKSSHFSKDSEAASVQHPAGSEKDTGICKKDSDEQTNSKKSISNRKVGFGVFANLDLDALNERKPMKKLDHQDTCLKNAVEKSNENLSMDEHSNRCVREEPKTDDTYGPSLPPNFSSSVSRSPENSKVESGKYNKHKSKHKHKSHKHKSKKKKKKKSSKRDSSNESESSDEYEDVPPALIIEKLKKLQKMKYH